MTEPTLIRVLIVDDHAVVRMGLRTFFELQPDMEVVGEAADGSEGVAMARRLEPDVVLMDLLMPNMDGITAIGRIKAERPSRPVPLAMSSRTPRPRRSQRPFVPRTRVRSTSIPPSRACSPSACATGRCPPTRSSSH